MAEDSAEVKMIKSMLRSVLISSKEGVRANVLLRDYEEVTGEQLPFRRLGFKSLEDFILSIPDVVRVSRQGPDYIFHAVADETTAHIKALVSKQRSKRKLKKPVRRPRGGGAFGSRSRGPPPGPPKPAPSRPYGPKSRPGMPSFIPPEYRKPVPNINMTVQVGNSHSGSRTVHVGRTELLNRAMSEVHTQKQAERGSERYELPPRFRKQQPPGRGGSNAPQQQQPTRRVEKDTFGEIYQGQMYMDKLQQYLHERGEVRNFETTRTSRGYASSITVNKDTYGSEAIFKTAQEAEQAAARNAVLELERRAKQERPLPDIDWNNSSQSGSGSSLPANQIAQIRNRLHEIVKNKKNGLWSTRIPFEYKEKFKEEPPDNLVDLLRGWPDIARFEVAANTDRDIVFPVEENNNDNMNLVIPRDYLVTRDEEVVVYISYIFNPGYFCVQKEDSPIDDVTDQLQTYCQNQGPINPQLLQKGMFCAGLFSGDGNWTRAEVLHLKDNDIVELLFVDYGNIEAVKMSNIRWLSPELAKIPVQSITCSLYGMEPLEDEVEWSTKSTMLFAKHVEDTPLIATPREFYDGLVDVDLFLQSDRSVNIAKLLCDAGVIRDVSNEGITSPEQEILEPDAVVLPEDKEWDVHVTYISSSTNSVMLRLVGDEYSDRLDMFQTQLEKAFRSTDSQADIVEGGIYVAYDDELYHRVRAMSVENKKVLCYFLDHGDTDFLLTQQLEPLDPKVNKMLPYQAIEVSLHGLEEVSTNITALEKLCDTTLGKTCVAEVIESLHGLEEVSTNITAVEKLCDTTLGKTCVAEVIERDEIPSLVLYDTSSDAEVNINEAILKTIEKEGGGIDSPRVISPVPGRVISPAPTSTSASTTPNRVLSPATSASNIPTTQANCDKDSLLTNTATNVDSRQNGALDKADKTSQLDLRTSPNQNTSPSNIIQSQSDVIPTDVNSNLQSVQKKVLNSLEGLSLQSIGDVKVVAESSTQKSEGVVLKNYPLPPIGGYIDVHVPFVYDPHNFVCIPYEELNTVNQLLKDMQEYYNKQDLKPMNPSDIQKGCAYAGIRDDFWMRVRVQEFVGTDLVSVHSVDIGDYSVIGLAELQPLPAKFAELPMMAIAGKLGKIKPKGATWYEATKFKFIQLARGKDLVALVQSVEGDFIDFRLIDTSDENIDVCIDDVLVKRGFADVV